MFVVDEDVIIDDVSMKSKGLYLASKEIGVAEARISTVEVPGRNGVVDVTDFVGVTYSNRSINLTFNMMDYNEYLTHRLELEKMNGKKVNLVFEKESDIYWSGRLRFKSIKAANGLAIKITAELDAEPFPYDVNTGEVVTDVPDSD